MEMINATLIVQVGNFLLAYLLLRKFFFLPIVNRIQVEREAEKAMQEKLVQIQQRVDMQERVKKEGWYLFRSELEGKVPPAPSQGLFVFRYLKQPIAVSALDNTTKNRLEKEVAATIVDTVNHALY